MPSKNMTPTEALKKVFNACGGRATVAREFDISTQAVYKWGAWIPAERVLPLLKFALSRGCAVYPSQIRPDIYPKRLRT